MRDLPRGTITFLFADIEGSTRLLKRLGDRYAELLSDYQRIIRKTLVEAGGHEIDTQGDSFFVAFGRAKDALEGSVAAQRALAAHHWPDGARVHVRMGLHTGEPIVGEDRYVGIGVHKAARIGAAAHGGQILVSNATRELVADDLPAGVRLVDLGEQPLKDIDRLERIFQVRASGLRQRFPPRQAAAATPAAGGRLSRVRPRTALIVAVGFLLLGTVVGIVLARSDRGATRGGPHGGGAETSRLTSPEHDANTIIPGKSIGAISLGLSEETVTALYGDGRTTEWRSHGKEGTTRQYAAEGGTLSASFYDGSVVRIATTDPYYATSDGIRAREQPPYPAIDRPQRRDDALRQASS
jgi:class 3 adenylate cyclase